MGRLDDSLGALETAVDLLEDSAARLLATRLSKEDRSGKKGASAGFSGSTAKNKKTHVKKEDLAGSLFSPEELTDVKQQLDTAMEQLETVLEIADGSR